MSRRREYQHLARLFSNCTDLTEAHLLSAAIVGPGNTRHLFGEFIRQTDSNSTAIWEEPPFLVPLRPRVRGGFRDRLEQESIHSKAKQKEKTLAAYLQLRQEEAEVLDRHVRDAVIDFSSLPILEPPHVRVTLLHWVSKAMGNQARIGQTEDGRTYRLEINTHEQIVLRCEDGNLRMPSIKIKFLETKRGGEFLEEVLLLMENFWILREERPDDYYRIKDKESELRDFSGQARVHIGSQSASDSTDKNPGGRPGRGWGGSEDFRNPWTMFFVLTLSFFGR